MTPQAAVSVAVAAAIFGAGWWVGDEVRLGAVNAASVADQKARTETAQVIASRLAEMATPQHKVTERVTHEVRTNTVYGGCVLPDDGKRLLNDAINITGTGGDGVQAPAD
jgi:hypothetical protein